jgi:hypothetical protein
MGSYKVQMASLGGRDTVNQCYTLIYMSHFHLYYKLFPSFNNTEHVTFVTVNETIQIFLREK